MPTKNNPLDSLPQNEWDAFIRSIVHPFIYYAQQDTLVSYDDLEQEAWVALLTAAQNYNPKKSKFTTYAYIYIRGRMLRYVSEKTKLSSIKYPLRSYDEIPEKGYIDNSCDDKELMNHMIESIENEPHADFLIEHFVNGKSFRKIAKECNMSHQGVAMHVKRLVELLEKRLNHENA